MVASSVFAMNGPLKREGAGDYGSKQLPRVGPVCRVRISLLVRTVLLRRPDLLCPPGLVRYFGRGIVVAGPFHSVLRRLARGIARKVRPQSAAYRAPSVLAAISAPEINLLMLGEDVARGLGQNLARTRWTGLASASVTGVGPAERRLNTQPRLWQRHSASGPPRTTLQHQPANRKPLVNRGTDCVVPCLGHHANPSRLPWCLPHVDRCLHD